MNIAVQQHQMSPSVEEVRCLPPTWAAPSMPVQPPKELVFTLDRFMVGASKGARSHTLQVLHRHHACLEHNIVRQHMRSAHFHRPLLCGACDHHSNALHSPATMRMSQLL